MLLWIPIRFYHFLGYVFLDTWFGFIFLFGSLFVAGEAKISIFPRVFGVFRLVWGVFLVCLVGCAGRFEATSIFRKMAKSLGKIAISCRLLPFLDASAYVCRTPWKTQPIFGKMAKTLRKIAISRRLQLFFLPEKNPLSKPKRIHFAIPRRKKRITVSVPPRWFLGPISV